jgi:hypothetical protein
MGGMMLFPLGGRSVVVIGAGTDRILAWANANKLMNPNPIRASQATE